MRHILRNLLALTLLLAGAGDISPADAILFSGSGGGAPPPPGGSVTSFQVFNTSGSPVSGQLVSFEQPLETGAVATSQKIQIRKNDGVTIIATQEDGCSKWSQDSSRKACAISFVEPDSIGSGSNVTYQVWSVSGSPSTTPAVTTGNITANTAIVVKSVDLMEAAGTTEPGTWDLIALNYVLANCAQYNGSTGYGADPKCGWDVVATGPNRYGLHAFQYARKEEDGSFHKWLRTDLWVDFWGTGSTPCPCSVAVKISQPNSFGPISGGTGGPASEPGYIFSAQVLNGANVIYNLGGAGDTRVANVTFDHTTGKVTFPGGSASWVENTAGVFGVKFSGTVPTGLTAGTPYFFLTYGANPDLITSSFQLYPYQCAPAANCSASALTFSDNGTGTITATPVVMTTAFCGFLALDTSAQRFWISAAGTVTSPPPTLIGHDFTYLTQKTKATLPYLTALAGNLRAYPTPTLTYYPNTYYWPWDMNTTGDGPGDERVGYMNHSAVYELMMPADKNAAIGAAVAAASLSRYHYYHIDEHVGLPDIFNDGPLKDGTTHYPTFGANQPTTRTYPYSGGAWLTPDSATANFDPINERYGVWADTSHFPGPQQGPLLKTGYPEWIDQMEQETNANVGQLEYLSDTVAGVTYYRPFGDQRTDGQTRGVAWGTAREDTANFYEPASAPMAQYLHDLVSDNINYLNQYAINSATAPEKTLGYFWHDVDTGQTSYQWWQDDFLFLSSGMNAWRGENPGASTWITYFSKHVIGRMDSSVGGCLWISPTRSVQAASVNGDVSTIATTWGQFFINTQGFDTVPNPWAGCPGSGFNTDGAGTNPSYPGCGGMAINVSDSAAIGAVLGVTNAASLYTASRALEYGYSTPLSFITFTVSGVTGSFPECAIGPLGASN